MSRTVPRKNLTDNPLPVVMDIHRPKPNRKPRGIFAILHIAVRKVYALLKRNRLSVILVALLLIAVVPIAYRFLPGSLGGIKDGFTTTSLPHGNPDYPTITPVGQNIGSWTRVSPPGSAPVYAFADDIDGVQITVSEQPLPEDLRQNTADRIYRIARDFGANEKVTVDGTTVYIGTSTKGPQSVIFYKNSLLVLIKSVAPLSGNQWAEYINDLQ